MKQLSLFCVIILLVIIMNELVNKLISLNKTIASMESCTGGGFVNAFTNIPGSSEALRFSAVTYSNEYKIKMGVSSDTISKYSVYSMEVATEMSKQISIFADSNYGVGITGKLNRVDKANNFGKDNLVYISIYDKDNNKYHNMSVEVTKNSREGNKNFIINLIVSELLRII